MARLRESPLHLEYLEHGATKHDIQIHDQVFQLNLGAIGFYHSCARADLRGQNARNFRLVE
jgi:hypothetical protein